MKEMFLYGLGVWFIILIAAVLNGSARDFLYKKELGKKKEHAEKESKKEDLPNESKNKYDLDKKTSDSESFVLNDGKKLFCLRDLLNALDEMPDYVFNHHVLQGRNDFSSWTEGALKYSDLAEEINSAKSKKALAEILQKYK